MALALDLALPGDRVGDGEVGGRIAGPLILVAADEGRVVAVAPTDDETRHPLLQLTAHVEEPCSFQGAQPLVGVPAPSLSFRALQRRGRTRGFSALTGRVIVCFCQV